LPKKEGLNSKKAGKVVEEGWYEDDSEERVVEEEESRMAGSKDRLDCRESQRVVLFSTAFSHFT
jgi:hypothetical protein